MACSHLAQTGHYVEELLRLELWPISNIATKKTIAMVLKQIEQFEDYAYIGGKSCSCGGGSFNAKKLLQELSNKHSNQLRGLCLHCVKKGKITRIEGSCMESSLLKCKR